MLTPTAGASNKTTNYGRAYGSHYKKFLGDEFNAYQGAMRKEKSDHQSRKVLPAHRHASTYNGGGKPHSSLYPATKGGHLHTTPAAALPPLSRPPSSGSIPSVQSNLAELVEVEAQIRKLEKAREVRSVQPRQEQLKRVILFNHQEQEQQRRHDELLLAILLNKAKLR